VGSKASLWLVTRPVVLQNLCLPVGCRYIDSTCLKSLKKAQKRLVKRMKEITVTVKNAYKDFTKSVDIPVDMKVEEFKQAAAEMAGLSNIPVLLIDEGTNKVLQDNLTFDELNAKDGDVFVLHPDGEGGGVRLNISAPINIPDIEEMTVLLVQADVVSRLEEYRSDQQHWESIMWTLIGAVLGVLVNWVTSEPMVISKVSILVIVLFLVFSFIAFTAAFKYRKRAEKMKDRILSSRKVSG
jgi:hypothetical protein